MDIGQEARTPPVFVRRNFQFVYDFLCEDVAGLSRASRRFFIADRRRWSDVGLKADKVIIRVPGRFPRIWQWLP